MRTLALALLSATPVSAETVIEGNRPAPALPRPRPALPPFQRPPTKTSSLASLHSTSEAMNRHCSA